MNTPTRIGWTTNNQPICDHCADADDIEASDWDDDPDSAPTCATCGQMLPYLDIGNEA